MRDPETVFVQREKSEDNPTGVVVINKSDLAEGDVVVTETGEAIVEPATTTEPVAIEPATVETTVAEEPAIVEAPAEAAAEPVAEGVVKAPWAK